MDSAELLAQLADIHLPGPVAFWPPAPGWWILALLVLVAAIWLTLLVLKAKRQRKICAFALQELDQVYEAFTRSAQADEQTLNAARLEFLNQFNAVLRRVALWHFPGSRAASLNGRAWVDFIRQTGESSLLTDEIAEALIDGRFRAHCEVDAEQLHQLGERWIVSLYMNRPGAGASDKLRA